MLCDLINGGYSQGTQYFMIKSVNYSIFIEDSFLC